MTLENGIQSFRVLLPSLFIFLFIEACSHRDIPQEQDAIISIMDSIVEAHQEKNAEKWYENYADSFVDVRDGQVRKLFKEQEILETQDYLYKMSFKELKLDNPIVHLSNSGQWGTYINSGHVKGYYEGSPVYFVFSMMNTLQKQSGQWKISSTSNTEIPVNQLHSHIYEGSVASIGYNRSEDSVTSIYSLARCDGPSGPFTTLVCSTSEVIRFEQVVEDEQMIITLSPDHSWTSSGKNISDLPGNTPMREFVNGHELHWLILYPDSRYPNPGYQGISIFNNKECFHIQYADSSHVVADFFYSFDTFLPEGFRIYPEGLGPDGVSVTYSSWEDVDGISLPNKAVFHQGDQRFSYDFTEIMLNSIDRQQLQLQEPMLK